MTRRLIRAALTLVGLVVVCAVGALASDTGGAPVISSIDGGYVFAAGTTIGIHGSNFYSTVVSDCSALPNHSAPSVEFDSDSGGSSFTVGPVSTQTSDCNNGFIRVQLPGSFSGAYHVIVHDGSGNNSSGGFVPETTAQPSASVNPTSGQVGDKTAVVGAGLRPATAASPSVSVTLSGSRQVLGWSDTRIDFDPANQSGAVQVSFPVWTDYKNHATTQAVTVNAGSYQFNAPSLDQSTVDHRVVGSQFNIGGSNLGSGTGSYLTFAGGVRGQGLQWSPGSVGVTVPAGAQSGQVMAFVGGYGTIPGPTVNLDPKPTGMNPGSASAGQQVHLSGYNFGSGNPGSVTVGGAPQPVAQWSDQAVTFVVSPDSDGGQVVLTRTDGVAAAGPNLTIVPHLDRLESNNVAPGSQVVVDGASLGSGTGHAVVGSADAQPLLWSRQSVLLQLPASIAPGTYPVVVTSAAGAASNALSLTIISAPSPKPGETHTPGIAGAVAPSFDNSHQFVKPIKPPSPVYFNISVDPHKVNAGGTADITVTLKLNDKPVSGSAVELAMLFTPGGDYKFTPVSGVTDADGLFKARVTVSKSPGDSVIAATSGVFSDQDHVTGVGANGTTAPVSKAAPVANGGFAPLVIVGVLAVMLVAAGFYLNIRSMGS